jgi:hypothetical protein
LTRSEKSAHIDVAATIQTGLRELQQAARERILRELRYAPGFTGDMTFTIKFKLGTPFAITEGCTNHALIPPVTD